MKTILTALLIAFITSSFDSTHSDLKPHYQLSQNHVVYICKGPNSLRFHQNSNCRGLNNCTTQIYRVSTSEAKHLGRTHCKICY